MLDHCEEGNVDSQPCGGDEAKVLEPQDCLHDRYMLDIDWLALDCNAAEPFTHSGTGTDVAGNHQPPSQNCGDSATLGERVLVLDAQGRQVLCAAALSDFVALEHQLLQLGTLVLRRGEGRSNQSDVSRSPPQKKRPRNVCGVDRSALWGKLIESELLFAQEKQRLVETYMEVGLVNIKLFSQTLVFFVFDKHYYDRCTSILMTELSISVLQELFAICWPSALAWLFKTRIQMSMLMLIQSLGTIFVLHMPLRLLLCELKTSCFALQ